MIKMQLKDHEEEKCGVYLNRPKHLFQRWKIIHKDSLKPSISIMWFSSIYFSPKRQRFTLTENALPNHAGFQNPFHGVVFKLLAGLGN